MFEADLNSYDGLQLVEIRESRWHENGLGRSGLYIVNSAIVSNIAELDEVRRVIVLPRARLDAVLVDPAQIEESQRGSQTSDHADIE